MFSSVSYTLHICGTQCYQSHNNYRKIKVDNKFESNQTLDMRDELRTINNFARNFSCGGKVLLKNQG